MDTFSRTKRQFHLHLADTKQDLSFLAKERYWIKKKVYIYFINLLSVLFTTSSVFLSVPIPGTPLFFLQKTCIQQESQAQHSFIFQ